MRIPPYITNLKFLRKIDKIESVFSFYEEGIKNRNDDACDEKPINMEVSLTKIRIFMPYAFENYEIIHNLIINKFKKSDFFRHIKMLSDDSRSIDRRGWNSLGLIVPKNTKNPNLKYNSLVVDNIPKGTKFIKGNIYRLLPSTYTLCFEFYLEENFLKDIYSEFYSKDDILVHIHGFLKKISHTNITSKEKYNKRLDYKLKTLTSWIFDFFGFKKDYFICTGSITLNELKNLDPAKSNLEIISLNRRYFITQSIHAKHPSTYSNNNAIFSIEDLVNFRLYTFDMDNENHLDESSDFIENIFILSIIKMYKSKLEDIRHKNINSNKKTRIIELKNETLNLNNISYQIYRFFQEAKFYNIEYEIKQISSFNFTSKFQSGDYDLREFSAYCETYFNHYEKILIENSQSINSLLEKELNGLSLEVNYNLQQTIKKLTYVAIFIALLSLGVTAITADFNKLSLIFKNIINLVY
ncbi:hypothetical protein [Acinetobacter pittii]|uniref:hypothetical protein n=1 Tax=Acinetobacter pittii TaxID=48296 RepID=UPI00192B8A4C|nr:hypothetical protein [Acinetobacter pittii]